MGPNVIALKPTGEKKKKNHSDFNKIKGLDRRVQPYKYPPGCILV